MRAFTYIVSGVAFTSLAFGTYECVVERAFLKHAINAVAVIQHVDDIPISIITEGRLNGSHKYVDHNCKYAVSLDLPNSQTTTGHLIVIGKPCLPSGESLDVVYDPRSPSDSIRTQSDQAKLPAGVLWIGFGALLIFLCYLDYRKSRTIR
jgi:hypothetical protein